MRKALLCLLFFCSVQALAEGVDYKKISQARTGIINGKVVRYLSTFSDVCIVIQVLRSGGGGEVESESKVCSLNGKRFNDDYADVELKDGRFEGDKLILELGFTPLEPVGEKIMECELSFSAGVLAPLRCQD